MVWFGVRPRHVLRWRGSLGTMLAGGLAWGRGAAFPVSEDVFRLQMWEIFWPIAKRIASVQFLQRNFSVDKAGPSGEGRGTASGLTQPSPTVNCRWPWG